MSKPHSPGLIPMLDSMPTSRARDPSSNPTQSRSSNQTLVNIGAVTLMGGGLGGECNGSHLVIEVWVHFTTLISRGILETGL